jgi:hypothetical protein
MAQRKENSMSTYRTLITAGLAGLLALALSATLAGPALGDTVISAVYKNTTVFTAYDFHWDFGPYTLGVSNTSGGITFGSCQTTASQSANTLDVKLYNGWLGSQGSDTFSVTLNSNSVSQTTPWWSDNVGAFLGSAGTPFSLSGTPGMTGTQWTVAIDNRDLQTTHALVVHGLQTATTTVKYTAAALRSGTFAWSSPYSDIMVPVGSEYDFTVYTAPNEFPVLQAELWQDTLYTTTDMGLMAEVTPEPATLSLLVLGGLALLRRRRG